MRMFARKVRCLEGGTYTRVDGEVDKDAAWTGASVGKERSGDGRIHFVSQWQLIERGESVIPEYYCERC